MKRLNMPRFGSNGRFFEWLVVKPFCGFFTKHQFIVDKSQPVGYKGGKFRVLSFRSHCLRCGKEEALAEDGFPFSEEKLMTVGKFPGENIPKPPPPGHSVVKSK